MSYVMDAIEDDIKNGCSTNFVRDRDLYSKLLQLSQLDYITA